MCKNCCGEAPEMGEGMYERALMDEKMDASAAMVDPTPESRLDILSMNCRERNEAVRDEMSSYMKGNSRNTEDIWARLNRIEAVLGLPPIADVQKGKW